MYIELVHRITLDEEESEIITNFDRLITTISELTESDDNEDLAETLDVLACGLRRLNRIIVMD